MSHIPRVDYDALSILRDALTFLGGAKGCQAALEWSKLMRFNLNDKKFLPAADTLTMSHSL